MEHNEHKANEPRNVPYIIIGLEFAGSARSASNSLALSYLLLLL